MNKNNITASYAFHIFKFIIIIIIINEFHRDATHASLKENFKAAVCHVLH